MEPTDKHPATPQQPEDYTSFVHVSVKPSEKAAYVRQASKEGKGFQTWVREVLNKYVKSENKL